MQCLGGLINARTTHSHVIQLSGLQSRPWRELSSISRELQQGPVLVVVVEVLAMGGGAEPGSGEEAGGVGRDMRSTNRLGFSIGNCR